MIIQGNLMSKLTKESKELPIETLNDEQIEKVSGGGMKLREFDIFTETLPTDPARRSRKVIVNCSDN
jgi:hypothetical protein